MSVFITNLLVLFLGLTLFVSVVGDLVLYRNHRRFIVTVIAIFLVVMLLNLFTGFPRYKYHFGIDNEILMVLIMLTGVHCRNFSQHNIFFEYQVHDPSISKAGLDIANCHPTLARNPWKYDVRTNSTAYLMVHLLPKWVLLETGPFRCKSQHVNFLTGLIALFLAGIAMTINVVYAGTEDIDQNYRDFVWFDRPEKASFLERALRTIGISTVEIGRSYAVIAGVYNYPNFSTSSHLAPARSDIEQLKHYLRDQEQFDEIIVLENENFNERTLSYFLKEYLPKQFEREKKRSLPICI